MDFPRHFIRATERFCTFEAPVPAPYLRRSFSLAEKARQGEMLICGLGFYELYINGTALTKGALAPYISAPDDLVYYDRYDIAPYLRVGENVIGVALGNGMQNAFAGYIWQFDEASWRGAPMLALRARIELENGETLEMEADEKFRTAPSPIRFDDLRSGERYDAREELPGWNMPGFDDGNWQGAQRARTPAGRPMLCEADPIAVTEERKPVAITPCEDGYIYDFGVNDAGVCELCVTGWPGQEISLEHGERLVAGKVDVAEFSFFPEGYAQKDVYICRGGGEERYVPHFTYHGFRYVFVRGIEPRQAVPELLTYRVMHSALRERGGFRCSDPTVNALQEMTRRATLANFYYFPTDCPHREKNGWTGDAALSAEHTLLNLEPDASYREWLRNIRAAQTEAGALPGIVPTGGWGLEGANCPAWDCVLTWIPYHLYVFRGDRETVRENATAILRQVNYLAMQMDEEGLVDYGDLGDWCPPDRPAEAYQAPKALTGSAIALDICRKAAFLFREMGLAEHAAFCEGIGARIRAGIRKKLIDPRTLVAAGDCQTSQAMLLYYGAYEPEERERAFAILVGQIEAAGKHMDTGVLGGRVIFRVLSAFGRSDLALDMILNPTFPSYADWVRRGGTALWEDFHPEGGVMNSHNHHFWGDISAWFIEELAGIHLNPRGTDVNRVDIAPRFVERLQSAQGWHEAPGGRIEVRWSREGDGVLLEVEAPAGMAGCLRMTDGYVFADGTLEKPLTAGRYRVQRG